MKNPSEKDKKILLKMQQDEIDGYYIYHDMAKHAKGDENKKILRQIANDEKSHYQNWKRYTKQDLKPRNARNQFIGCFHFIHNWFIGKEVFGS